MYFSSWGDGVFLGLQTLAIAVLVMHFSGNTVQATAFLAAYLAVLFAATSGLTPVNVLWACQAMNIPIVLISKVWSLKIKAMVVEITDYNNFTLFPVDASLHKLF